MHSLPQFSVIIVAAGGGTRLAADIPKQYIEICGRTILRHTLDIFVEMNALQEICVVINPAHKALFQSATVGLDNIKFCLGGDERKDSVYNGIKTFSHLKDDDIVLIHDAARPFVQEAEIKTLITAMEHHKAASLAHRVTDSLSYCDQDNFTTSRISRENLWSVQTPQAFHYGILEQAHAQCDESKSYTDDTALVSALDIAVKFVEGCKSNFKITLAEDLALAEHILSTRLSTDIRTGLGYDVHAFDDNAKDITHIRLCGVDIAHNRKLKGHSDADVGLHALTDAILGAIGEGDIGLHFPPSNMDFKNMNSAVFLEHAMKLLRDKGGALINADVTLICERPKIGAYREQIVARVAEILEVSPKRVNIKATTSEKLGFTGREEGIAAQAAVSVSLPSLDKD
ncbi:MAG: bifunctional 2-C-methyl-D-erythritol 4-phosphate cytidylyltransferase/2-C-methyl-D-erythritol 2,4-cyclodiphosphate synthase [Alphaproteobacteria bacterium]|nr:MAG: bifunctional 2-C-methyl-D-erythritol 4-phosphate cytidylyltransferase/2-C-methyl-D-erythritol 2,4-cyclodiphosphate synthase [Alphaproteobacteria bacterium]